MVLEGSVRCFCELLLVAAACLPADAGGPHTPVVPTTFQSEEGSYRSWSPSGPGTLNLGGGGHSFTSESGSAPDGESSGLWSMNTEKNPYISVPPRSGSLTPYSSTAPSLPLYGAAPSWSPYVGAGLSVGPELLLLLSSHQLPLSPSWRFVGGPLGGVEAHPAFSSPHIVHRHRAFQRATDSRIDAKYSQDFLDQGPGTQKFQR